MALVTVQRSPSAAGSPQCSKSDSETEEEDASRAEKNCSGCFFAARDTALVLDLKDIPQHSERRLSTDSTISTNSTQSNNSDIQQHLQSMFYLLRHGETLKMAVKLESQRPNRTRYLVITSRNRCHAALTAERKNKTGRSVSAKTAAAAPSSINVLRQNSVDSNRSTQIDSGLEANDEKRRLLVVSNSSTINRSSVRSADAEQTKSNDCDESKCSEGTAEESCLLGIDCNERATIGLVVPILADTTIHLDGDGGFSVAVFGKTHIFKPVSVQAMWSALQTLHKVSQKARENNFYPGGPSHEWLSYYENRIESDQSCLNEWNAMDAIESRRPPSPDAIRNKPTEKEETESVIKMKLKEIMMSVDLDEVTSKYIRGRLEEHLDMDLGEYKSFIDQEMLIILGQMDAPTEIFDHVYLGSEWNASNLEELQKNGVRHILNVTREIDNFFPGMFDYFNVRVYDDEKTNLLKHWDNTFRYINRAKDEGSKVLVHCKMGVSRSASVVIAYAMKAYNWEFQKAMTHVKERRNCIKPNKNFLNQLETYRGMLDAMKNKEKLQRSKSETNLKSTKDARLLPGSEPTPLIQALNQSQSKTKSKTHAVSGDGTDVEVSGGIVSVSSLSSASEHKHRKLMRRSSSTSPKGLQGHTTIVIKQQSQSLENLTPERNMSDEPKNVRFPGNNGENYSVTQNQVLHIQKHTPPANAAAPTSVKTIVSDLESFRERKSVDDRKSLNLQLSRAVSVDVGNSKADADGAAETPAPAQKSVSAKPGVGSPVWTSSAKLITQTSTLPAQSAIEAPTSASTPRNSIRLRRDTNCSGGSGDMFSSQLDNVFEKEEVRQTRKTQSWAASTGGIILDHLSAQSQSHSGFVTGSRKSSSSSIDSSITNNPCEGFVSVRTRHRELPFRHSSWGSGDQRNSLPTRNSSWGAYDTNRNSFQYGGSAATAAAIIEGQIHELSMSNKTVPGSLCPASKLSSSAHQSKEPPIGTVKRTKQKLEESTVLKKLCQGNGAELSSSSSSASAAGTAGQKRYSNLYRSQSAAAASTRCRFSNRCNSEEFVSSAGAVSCQQRRLIQRRSDGSKPLRSELFSASAPESYTISDIENKNTLPHDPASSEDQRNVSGNVQILKKNFELKAGGSRSVATSKKGHQSLPSSPVAQHVDHVTLPTANSYFNTQTNSATTASCPDDPNNAAQTISEPGADHNVKGLVHRYQSSSSGEKTSNAFTQPLATVITTITSSSIKTRPRSYYENRHHHHQHQHHHHSSTEAQYKPGKPQHGYNDSKPPPAPVKGASCGIMSSSVAHPQTMTENILAHHQQRRVQQHGKTHPLARLSLPKQNFNAAAYNTM